MKKLNNVFGVKNKLIQSYIERSEVDKKFLNAIKDGNEVIVYGSSKQGKSSLILKHLKSSEYIKIECSPKMQTIDIYKSILRQSHISFTESETRTTSKDEIGKINGGLKGKLVVFEASLGSEASERNNETISKKNNLFSYNLELAQDVIELLKNNQFEKYIILENFHYLSQEVQEKFSFDLRNYQDAGIIFIILGIWREANRLVQFNGDLVDRISEVPVEPWSKDDFFKVIEKGGDLLNVDFTEVINDIIKESFDSVGVVQELCKKCCENAGVESTQPNLIKITNENLIAAIEAKAEEYGSRHCRSFESFVTISKKTSAQSGKPSLAFPFYFIKLLLTTKIENLEKGLTRSFLTEEIRKDHHRGEDVRSGDLGAFLHNITQHQINKKINPPFVDYDRASKTLKIIDSSLYFFLRSCDRNEIFDDLPNPLSDIIDSI